MKELTERLLISHYAILERTERKTHNTANDNRARLYTESREIVLSKFTTTTTDIHTILLVVYILPTLLALYRL